MNDNTELRNETKRDYGALGMQIATFGFVFHLWLQSQSVPVAKADGALNLAITAGFATMLYPLVWKVYDRLSNRRASA